MKRAAKDTWQGNASTWRVGVFFVFFGYTVHLLVTEICELIHKKFAFLKYSVANSSAETCCALVEGHECYLSLADSEHIALLQSGVSVPS